MQGWLVRQRDPIITGVIVTVVGGLVVAAVLAGLGVLPTGGEDPSTEPTSMPTTTEVTTTTTSSESEPTTTDETSPTTWGERRDPETGTVNISEHDSAEFFSRELTVTLGRIESGADLEYVIRRLVLRRGDFHCETANARTGAAVSMRTGGTFYRVEIRAIDLFSADVVGFRRSPASRADKCLRLLPNR